MASYKSGEIKVSRSDEDMFERFADLSRLQGALDGLTPEQRAQVGDVEFSRDGISIKTPQVGNIAFEVQERVKPSKVVFGTKSSPVPLTMEVNIKPVDAQSCLVQTVINVEIPAMLKPLIGPQMQKAVDKFGELMGSLAAV